MICGSARLAKDTMSFFNSLQQYVTSGVAGLGLSPRRFSLQRQESTEPPVVTGDKKETTNPQAHHGKCCGLKSLYCAEFGD